MIKGAKKRFFASRASAWIKKYTIYNIFLKKHLHFLNLYVIIVGAWYAIIIIVA